MSLTAPTPGLCAALASLTASCSLLFSIASDERDAAPADARSADATAHDASAHDASTPEASVAACADRYGALTGFELCHEDADSCSFYVEPPEQSCDDVCAVGGGTCSLATDSDSDSHCAPDEQSRCDEEHSTVQCTCALR